MQNQGRQVAQEIASKLDVSADFAMFLLVVLLIVGIAWVISWVFLPWFVFSKLNRIADKLGSIQTATSKIRGTIEDLESRCRTIDQRLESLQKTVLDFSRSASVRSE